MPDKEFQVVVIKIFTEIEKIVEDFSENLNRDRKQKEELIRDEELNK